LAYIIDKIENKKHIGVCLDTCHIFAAGYPIIEPADYKKTIQQFDDIIGLKRLRIVHMNDSQKPFASQRDRHEHIGKGCIGLEAFRHIVNDSKLKEIPKILETPKGEDVAEDIENLRVLRSLVA
jgi:deoxyribonuclease-4